MHLLLHSPDFWLGFASCFLLLALAALLLLAVYVPELREVRWPAVPATLPAPRPLSRASAGRRDRAEARRWPHDATAANEEGELRLIDWRREASPLPWDRPRRQGGEL